ncbi:MAG TPA: DNA translocase FtsK, partial [Deinococcales bacterium]|nr:DNA translocase FtsK [Deinococcales bacterium]
FEAVFEIDLPSGSQAVAAAPAPVAVAVGAGDDDDLPPWSPPSRAGSAHDEHSARRPAASAVGERVHAGKASSVPGLGGIPIQVPGGQFLDPVSVSGLDVLAIEKTARARARVIDETLSHFGLQAKVVDYARGPTVTRYELEPAPGEKISRIQSLQNDLARALAVGGVRIEAPVPGKSVIGLEVPNQDREPVTFRTGIEDATFARGKAKLPILLGKSIDGEMVVGDLARMPHVLIAGSTGSGKSVCVNTLIMSLIFRYLPTQLRFVMVDPKMVELTPYDGIPHLVRPVVTNPSDAAGVLLGCVAHMERRYKMMSAVGAKSLEQYNQKAREVNEDELPYVVIIIDELADLMITSPKEVESAIMRLAQMARATGMHLVLATQRPSVDILTSLIKVNVPARIAFAVSSGHDSRTILDAGGAERLTGYGDMLFYQPGLVKPQRLQGPYISEGELARITEFLRRQYFDDDFGEAYGADFDGIVEGPQSSAPQNIDFSDPLIKQAAEICIEEGYASVSRLQRRLAVGHARAGKLVDALEAMKIVGPHVGSKAREVLITREMLPEFFG